MSAAETHSTGGTSHYQVIVCGAGPTGLMLANLFGTYGIKTLIVERNASTVSEPRAVSIDDEALRTAQAAGLVDAVLADVMLDYGSYYFSAAGTCFAKVEPTTREYGYPRRNAFRQPLLEATLCKGLERFDHVDIRFGCTVSEFAQDAGHVTVTLDSDRGAAVTCDYLAACDGGRSFVRTALGIPLRGSTFEQRWLIIDLQGTKDRFRHTRIFSNPRRPGICLPGPHGTRRYEFMLTADEATEEAETEAFSRRLLRAHGPDGDTAIVRRQVYTFHARMAERWRDGRIFLLGDAAHLTPPFAGQGMNSGIRDAQNLAWKLAAVLRGELPVSLLETYQAERKPHAWALIELAMAIGRVMVPTSRTNAWLKQAFFRALGLWPPAKRYVSEMRFKPKPYYQSGFLSRTGDDFARRTVGRMAPQPIVETEGGERLLLDTLLGSGFGVLVLDEDSARAAQNVADLPDGVPAICVTPRSTIPAPAGGLPCVRDVEGSFDRYRRLTDRPVLIVRPDRYVADAWDAGTGVSAQARLKGLFNDKGSE